MDKAIQFAIHVAAASTKEIGLILIIFVLIESLKAVQAIDNLITKGRQGATRAAGGRLKDFAKRADQSRQIRALGGGKVFGRGKYRRRAKRDALNNAVGAEANRAQAEYISGLAQRDEVFRSKLAGGTPIGGYGATEEAMQRALAAAITVKANLEADEVKAANAVIQSANISSGELQKLAKGIDGVDGSGNAVKSSKAMQIAAIQHQAQTSVDNINDLLNDAAKGGWDSKSRQALADTLASSSSRPAYVGQKALEDIRQGVSKTAETLAAEAVSAGTYSADKIASADKDEVRFVGEVAVNHNPGSDPVNQKAWADAKATLEANATTALNDTRLNVKLGKSKKQVEAVSNGVVPPR